MGYGVLLRNGCMGLKGVGHKDGRMPCTLLCPQRRRGQHNGAFLVGAHLGCVLPCDAGVGRLGPDLEGPCKQTDNHQPGAWRTLANTAIWGRHHTRRCSHRMPSASSCGRAWLPDGCHLPFRILVPGLRCALTSCALPVHTKQSWSAEARRPYYNNQITREATWDRPADLAWRRIKVDSDS